MSGTTNNENRSSQSSTIASSAPTDALPAVPVLPQAADGDDDLTTAIKSSYSALTPRSDGTIPVAVVAGALVPIASVPPASAPVSAITDISTPAPAAPTAAPGPAVPEVANADPNTSASIDAKAGAAVAADEYEGDTFLTDPDTESFTHTSTGSNAVGAARRAPQSIASATESVARSKKTRKRNLRISSPIPVDSTVAPAAPAAPPAATGHDSKIDHKHNDSTKIVPASVQAEGVANDEADAEYGLDFGTDNDTDNDEFTPQSNAPVIAAAKPDSSTEHTLNELADSNSASKTTTSPNDTEKVRAAFIIGGYDDNQNRTVSPVTVPAGAVAAAAHESFDGTSTGSSFGSGDGKLLAKTKSSLTSASANASSTDSTHTPLQRSSISIRSRPIPAAGTTDTDSPSTSTAAARDDSRAALIRTPPVHVGPSSNAGSAVGSRHPTSSTQHKTGASRHALMSVTVKSPDPNQATEKSTCTPLPHSWFPHFDTTCLFITVCVCVCVHVLCAFRRGSKTKGERRRR
jgi:hypothetical protein